MGINMEMQEFWSFVINALLFFFAYKIGQVSVWMKIGQIHKAEIQNRITEVKLPGQRPVITVEEINGIFYAYDGNDFLAQAKSADELGRAIADRFPTKYHLAKVEIKA
jgi:hypothetical protein